MNKSKLISDIRDVLFSCVFGVLIIVGISANADDKPITQQDLDNSKLHYCVGATQNDQMMIDNPKLSQLCRANGFFDNDFRM